MNNHCYNCEQEIYGTLYVTDDDYILCSDCFYELKDDQMEISFNG